jgi:DNA processing protein
MTDEKLYEIALVMTEGLGCVLSRQLVSYGGSAKAVFQMPKGKLLKIPGIGEKLAEQILKQEALKAAEKEIELARKSGIQLIFFTDPDYPGRLRQIKDAPALLYLHGQNKLNAAKIISIVGTRNATDYGKQMTDEIINQLSKHRPLIVSGLAYGIDIQAHRSALKQGLETVGVMATGIDRIYPPTHAATARQMIEQGGLLTEYAFGTKPDAPRFPERNRIIAGLSDAVIVVEAAEKGGALITAEIAHSYDRDVFAVPGRITDKCSQGCNKLIASQQAHILRGLEDLEYVMNWAAEAPRKKEIELPEMTEDEQIVFDLLKQKKELHLDELAWQSQLGVSKTATALLTMEFKGLIKALPGKRFVLSV